MTFTTIGTTAQCINGGTRVDAGLDLNRNSVLDPGEITATSSVCNGSASAPVIVSTALAQATSNTSYIAANADGGLTTLVLPQSPSIGDVVQVNGAGAGGWRFALDAGQRIELGSGSRVASTSATTFVNQNFPTESYNPMAVSGNGQDAYLASGTRIWATHDSGRNWATSLNVAGNWRAIALTRDGKTVIAVGRPNLIYRSIDSGTTWNTIAGVTGQFESVGVSNDGRTIVIANDTAPGGLLVSTNAGVSFTSAPGLPSGNSWIEVSVSPSGKVMTGTQNSTLPGNRSVISTDFGATWSVISTPAAMFNLKLSADGSTLLGATSSPGGMHTSRDMGATWVRRLTIAPLRSYISANAETIIACEYGGPSRISFNGGVDWSVPSVTGLWYGCGLSADGAVAFIADATSNNVFRTERTFVTTSSTGGTGYLSGPQYSTASVQYVGGNTWLLTQSSGALGTN